MANALPPATGMPGFNTVLQAASISEPTPAAPEVPKQSPTQVTSLPNVACWNDLSKQHFELAKVWMKLGMKEWSTFDPSETLPANFQAISFA